MKIKLFLLCAIFFGWQSFSQDYTIEGKVTDNGKALPGVSVYAKSTNYGTVTDENGDYQLKVSPGTYTLIFNFGNRREFKVNVDSNQRLDVDMSKAEEALDEVLVQAFRVNADSPITHSNFSKKEIEERNLGQDIPILLNVLPSVVSTTDAGNGVGYTSIRVRGSDASRVNVTLNGIPFNDQESQGSFWVNLPDFASSTENIQLQRGVGTSTNGSGAFGASLNILTEAKSDEPSAELSNSFGSFNTRRHTVEFGTGLLEDKFTFSGRLSQIKSDGYIDRASSDLKSYFLQGTFKEGNTFIKALTFGGNNVTYQAWNGIDRETLETDRTFNPSGQYTDENGQTQFYDNEVDNYKQDHYQLHLNQRLDQNWTTNLSLNYTYGRGYFEQYEENGDLAFHEIGPVTVGNETIEESDLIRRRWLDNDYYVISGTSTYTDSQLEFTSGLFYSYYTNDHFGEVIWSRFAGDSKIRDNYYFGTGTKQEFTAFSKATLKLDDRLSLFGDLQGRFVNYETIGLTSDKENLLVDENFNFFNPKAGATFELNAYQQLYASYGKARREPRRRDFENGITNPEVLDDFELGWRVDLGNSSINTNAYYMYYKDQMVLTGAIDDVGAPIRETSGESYRLGLEIDADIKINRLFSARPNLTLSRNKNIDFRANLDGQIRDLGETNISFSPEIIAANQLIYHPSEEFQINLISKYVGEQYMGNIDSEVSLLDSFFTNDINIVYEWKDVPLFKSVVFTGLVNNVFDVKYESNGYFFFFDSQNDAGQVQTIEGAGFYPQAGINFLAGVTLKF
ncbi:TonB-dependent receptor [Psychroflexus lacisalsi]|jgi:iron complex outermembrane receptor protein|uniref:TonB-dependent receptor n=1 Tax=Psychroflexus lacisalsi TaxID=503928 RepID=A0ABN1KAS1_9FLAO|nr:TonB-dependent receptor [Psychroflexus lacisalsi]MBZ9621224.1 TonB-dependent receptor [Psychroflexus lacisalsi]